MGDKSIEVFEHMWQLPRKSRRFFKIRQIRTGSIFGVGVPKHIVEEFELDGQGFQVRVEKTYDKIQIIYESGLGVRCHEQN